MRRQNGVAVGLFLSVSMAADLHTLYFSQESMSLS